MSQELVNAIVEMREEEALALTKELLAGGADPEEILGDCREAMEIVGQRFEEGQAFIPELMLAGEMLGEITTEIKPHMQGEGGGGPRLGKIVIGPIPE